MKTKKLLALITVICLLVCVAIPVAAAPGDRVMPEYNEELMGYELVCDGSTNVITVPAGEMPNIIMTAGSTVSFYAMDGDGNNGEYTVYFGRSPMDTVLAEEGNATAVFAGGMGCVYNYSEVELTFFITVSEPTGGEEPAGPVEGTMDNPVVLTELGDYTATVFEFTDPRFGMTYGSAVHYKWIADTTGLLMLTVDKDNATGWNYTVNNVTANNYGDMKYSDSDCNIYVVPVTEGDEVIFNVGSSWCNPGESVAFTLSMVAEPNGTFNAATELSNAQVTVPAGSYAIYTINGMLNGMELTVEGGAYYTVNNVLNGAALDGTPINLLVLVNEGDAEATYTLNAAYPVGSEGNPIPVTTENGLTSATVPFFEEVWYAVSSRLDGYTLTVEGEGAYVIVNGTKYEAVDGVVTVTLEAKGATIPVVIGNASWEDATFACEITAPVVDNTNPETGDMIAAALVLMLTSGTAVVCLKKKEN